ncbi:MAG: Tol-Pal system beta propeller repeat protein TolB [Chromatiaceae bacterium]|nr:Tol-Pal system beta propeller repeat protein TolB [Chromatiaceae bacterium]
MKRLFLLSLLLVGLARPALADLTIEIVGGQEGAQPIAVVPFGAPEGVGGTMEDLAQVIAADLGRTGRFKPLPRGDMPANPQTAEAVDLRDWRVLAMNNLVVGQINRRPDGLYQVDFALIDVYSGEQLAIMSLPSSPAELRYTAHRIADIIYERLTGAPGAFTSRLAYVTSEWGVDGQRVTLRVADADGHNPQTIVSSKEPLMSPAWSPDGRRLAYVSFESRQTAVFVQELATGRRERVASFPGINSSPAWSPDGNRLALTLSRDGNPEIYVLDLYSRATTRLTNSPGIDTEAAWSPDGSEIYFTSGRGGDPQIYRMPATGGEATRVTFERDYNGRASLSPDGRSLVMVTRVNGQFRIALMDLATRATRLLSRGGLDESPSFAPNGSMVIYATQSNGRGVLAVVSTDGKVGQRLSQDASEVREPAWSPPPP